jgi:predicted  nucleic acid-binding Zn-ribbon protein
MSDDWDRIEYAENESRLQAVYDRLQGLEQERRVVHSAEELEALEREIRAETDRLASVWLERQVQASLDSAEQQAAEAELIAAWAGRLKSTDRERVRIRTVGGGELELGVRYYRRRGDRRSGKR